MKNAHKFLKADYKVHLVFAGLAVLFMVLLPLTESASGIFLLLLWPILGFWQVLSALVLSIGFKDKVRRKYLLTVVAYFAILFIVLYSPFIMGENEFSEKFHYLWLLGSIPMAAWYAYQTYKDASYNPKSFWDLEF